MSRRKVSLCQALITVVAIYGVSATALVACANQGQRRTREDSPSAQDGAADVRSPATTAPGDSDKVLDEGAAARESFARQLTADFAATDNVVFAATGPGRRHLTVNVQPSCNENTMLGMLRFAPRLRQLGFEVVTCHGESAVGYLVPNDGAAPTIFDKRTGWYCGDNVDGLPSSCWRAREQCAYVHGSCTYRQQPAQCTVVDGVRACFATAEHCFTHRRMEAKQGRVSPDCFEVP
jgi:hypothetical protein